MTMKRASDLWLGLALAITVLMGTAWGQAQQDSLAEYARHKREEKQSEPAPKRVFDNDNLPREEHISVVGSAKEPASENNPADATANAESSAPADQPKDDSAVTDQKDPSKAKLELTPGQSAEDRQKVFDDWKKKIADQKASVDLQSRELDVMQREYRLRAVAVYSDAGNRLRNSASWDKEDKQYKEQIGAKQKALDAAKQQLADLQEKARRAGVPSKDRESN
jgi:hypothetical protein